MVMPDFVGEIQLAAGDKAKVAEAVAGIKNRQMCFLKRSRKPDGSAAWVPKKRHRKASLQLLNALDNQVLSFPLFFLFFC